MNNYICKKATREELVERWNYLIEIHPEKKEWEEFKKNALRNFDDNNSISYLGFLDGKSICEMTVYIENKAFEGDIDNPEGLLTDKMAYLAAFRTDKEYEGEGYFKKLYDYVENDLINIGYNELCLGVEPCEVRNMEIYFHLGFKKYIKTEIQHNPHEEIIIFYKKTLKEEK